MKFNPIIIKKINEDIIKFYPDKIDKIKVSIDEVIIWQYDNKNLTSAKKYIINRSEYYYSEWLHLLQHLNIIFDLS